MNISITFVPRRRKISSAPTTQTVKGRVVFFRAQRKKISTLKPLTVRIFAAAFSPPKTGNRISKPCLRFRPLHFSGKTVCTCTAFTVGFCGASRPAPPTQTRNRSSPYSAGKRVNMEYLPLPQPLFRGGQGFYIPCHQNAF